MLAVRALSEVEVRQKLARRGYETGEIEAATAALVRLRYLDDLTLAYNVATSLATRKLFGRARIAAELKRRGVGAGPAGEALQRVFSGIDEDDLALQASRSLRRVARGAASAEEKVKANERLARALLRRGFKGGAVVRALRENDGDSVEPPSDDRPQDTDDDEFQTDS